MLRAKRLYFYCSEKDKVEHYDNNFEMWNYEFTMGFMVCVLGMPCKATFHVINDEKVIWKIGHQISWSLHKFHWMFIFLYDVA
jgi:hypothetical protein